MVRLMGLFTAAVIVLGVTFAAPVMADPPPAPTVKCALDEYPETVNGTTTCKRVPGCQKDEVISYDATNKKFNCQKILKCDPKHQQAAYVNGKNVCIDIPDCEAQGKHYAFDGSKMVCQ